MHALLIAAQNEAETGFDWSGFAVPVVAGSVAIVVAIYNTRGETAALRRLKAMNDVIEKLPAGSEVLASFTAARDALAQRVALRMADTRTVVGRFPLWALGLALSVCSAALLLVLFRTIAPDYTGFELAANVATLSLLMGLTLANIIRMIDLWMQLRQLEHDVAQVRLPSSGE